MRLPKVRPASAGVSVAIVLGLAGIWVAKPRGALRRTIPAGTPLEVRLERALASNQSWPGDQFAATVATPVLVEGVVAIPEGARIKGKVVEARATAGGAGQSRLRLTLNCIMIDGRNYEVDTTDVALYGDGNSGPGLQLARARAAGGGGQTNPMPGASKRSFKVAHKGPFSGRTVAEAAVGNNLRIPRHSRLEFRLIQPLAVAVRGSSHNPH